MKKTIFRTLLTTMSLTIALATSPFAVLAAATQTLDLSFDPGTGFNNEVNRILVQPDGQILVGGWFTAYDGNPAHAIIRLNPDGTPDTTFASPFADTNQVHDMILLPDGRILTAGQFAFTGESRALHRLNQDGSMDEDFDEAIAADASEHFLTWDEGNVVLLHPDGKILVTSNSQAVWLNADGSFNRSLALPSGVCCPFSVAVHCDGSVYVAASRPQVGATIIRYHADGSIDGDFPEVLFFAGGFSSHHTPLAFQEDGKLLVRAIFDLVKVDGVEYPRKNLARFHADGTLDTAFDAAPADNWVQGVARTNVDSYYIGGTFEWVDGVETSHLAKLNEDGSLDTEFNVPVTGVRVVTIVIQDDGGILVGGHFTSVDGVSRNGIARITGTEGPLRPVFYEDWRHANFSGEDIEEDEISGMFADPRFHQIANLARFGLGFDSTSFPRDVPTVSIDEYLVDEVAGNYLNLTYEKERCPCVEWEVEFSPDLINWTASDPLQEETVLNGKYATVNVRDEVPVGDAGRRFVRLKAVDPFSKEESPLSTVRYFGYVKLTLTPEEDL